MRKCLVSGTWRSPQPGSREIKLDENLGRRCADLLRKAAHDVATVPEQRLCSSSDRQLIDICRAEARCLLTMDLD
ncbi:MAG: DUF5615 family PIN-like protein [Nitrospiraceae bacterium]